MHRFHIPHQEAHSKIPLLVGKWFAEVFNHGTLTIELYEPRGTDPQIPHTRDEGYIVVTGRGEFLNGNDRIKFTAGDFLFAAAGEVHRFENFSDDLSV